MAGLLSLISQKVMNIDGGNHLVVTKIGTNGTDGDTATLPNGIISSAMVATLPTLAGQTAPAITSITNTATGTTVTLDSTTAGAAQFFLLTIHSGNIAAI